MKVKLMQDDTTLTLTGFWIDKAGKRWDCTLTIASPLSLDLDTDWGIRLEDDLVFLTNLENMEETVVIPKSAIVSWTMIPVKISRKDELLIDAQVRWRQLRPKLILLPVLVPWWTLRILGRILSWLFRLFLEMLFAGPDMTVEEYIRKYR